MKFIVKIISFWFVILVVGLGVYIAMNNQEITGISLPFVINYMQMQAWKIYFSFFLLGIFVTSIHLGIENFKKTLEIRKLKKQLNSN